MSDGEAIAKVAIALIVLVGIVAFGGFLVFVVLPVVVLVVAIDVAMRASYNGKVKRLEAVNELVEQPALRNFDVRLHEGKIVIAWMVDLPSGSSLDIYRLAHDVAGPASEVVERGLCVHSTTRDFTNDLSEVFVDRDAPYGVHFYIPVVKGYSIEKRILPYSSMSFQRDVKIRERKQAVAVRGDAVRIDYKPGATNNQIEDDRSEATRAADEIVASLLQRKQRYSDLDEAIEKIRSNPGLSEAEKREAIEILETQSEPS